MNSKKLLSAVVGAALALSVFSFPAVKANAATDLVAQYKFEGNWKDTVSGSSVGTPSAGAAGTAPTLATDSTKGGVAKFTIGFLADKKESQVAFPNPFKGKDLPNGVTLSVWVKGAATDFSNWESIWTIKSADKGMAWLAGAPYFGFNNGENFIDVNAAHTEITKDKIDYLSGKKADKWTLVTTTMTKDTVTIYLDGEKFLSTADTGYVVKGGTGTAGLIDMIKAADTVNLGGAAFWGATGGLRDEFSLFNKALSAAEVKALLNPSTPATTPTDAPAASTNPETGDSSAAIYAVLAVLAAVGMVFASRKKRLN
jgi:LPXTG-motif cell wall-anchored protein